jgi:hypothetical protein
MRGEPMRPTSGSLRPDGPTTPTFRLSTLISTPSTPLAEKPSRPASENWKPLPLGADADHAAAEVVLADRGGGQVGPQLGNLARHPGDEGVRVRPGPERVFLGIRIFGRELVDPLDQLVDAGAALLGVELAGGAEPAIGARGARDQRGVGSSAGASRSPRRPCSPARRRA